MDTVVFIGDNLTQFPKINANIQTINVGTN